MISEFKNILLVFVMLWIFIPTETNAKNSSLKKTVTVLTLESNCSASAWIEAEKYLISEIKTLGFSVKKIPSKTCTAIEIKKELFEVAGKNNSVGSISIYVNKQSGLISTQLWLRQKKVSGMKFHSFDWQGEIIDKNAQSSALRIIEKFRANFQELAWLPNEKPVDKTEKNPVAPDKTTDKPVENKPIEKKTPPVKPPIAGKKLPDVFNRLFMSEMIGFMWSPGGIPAAMGVFMELGLKITPDYSTSLSVTAKTISADIKSDGDSASWFSSSIIAWFMIDNYKGKKLDLRSGVGAGMYYFLSTGTSTNTTVNRTSETIVGIAKIRFDLEYKFGKTMSLYLSTGLGYIYPTVKIRFHGEIQAETQNPLFEVFSGIKIIF